MCLYTMVCFSGASTACVLTQERSLGKQKNLNAGCAMPSQDNLKVALLNFYIANSSEASCVEDVACRTFISTRPYIDVSLSSQRTYALCEGSTHVITSIGDFPPSEHVDHRGLSARESPC